MKKNKIALSISILITSLLVNANNIEINYEDYVVKQNQELNKIFNNKIFYTFLADGFNESDLNNLFNQIYLNEGLLIKIRKLLHDNYYSLEVFSNLDNKSTNNILKNYNINFELDPLVFKVPESNANISIYNVLEQRQKISSNNFENEPLYTAQKYMLDNNNDNKGSSSIASAIRKLEGNNNKPVIAVLDSGYLDHEDVVGKVIGGYKFSTIYFSETNSPADGRSPNFYDIRTMRVLTNPDYDESVGEQPIYDDITCSDGHGMAMKHIISANSNNNLGISGIIDADIVSVKVLDLNCNDPTIRSFGLISDIAAGILWAAGNSFTDIPNTPKVADVMNLSFGALVESGCPSILQQAINTATNRGIVIVTSAGNNNDLATKYVPASCQNVITVGSNDDEGLKATHSNYGEFTVDLTAIGTDLLVANPRLGTTEYRLSTGTSGSAAIVSGVSGLLKKAYPTLDHQTIEYILKETVNEHNYNYSNINEDCSFNRCGKGIVDADKALTMAQIKIEYPSELSYYFNNRNSCKDNIIRDALSSYMNTCNLYKITINNNNEIEGSRYEIISKSKDNQRWLYNGTNQNITINSTIQTSVLGQEKNIILNNYNDNLDYAVRMCEDDVCYAPLPLSFDNAKQQRPLTCN